MRKAIIAAIVASALFAVGAFAAEFIVSSEDVASGTDGVVACASHVDVDFYEAEVDASGDYVVTGAQLRFYSAGGAEPPLSTQCEGFTAELAVGTGDDPEATLLFTEYEATGEIASGTIEVDFLGDAISVASIHQASVLVDGANLTADLAP